jgi:DNA-binding NtrC family response regulator
MSGGSRTRNPEWSTQTLRKTKSEWIVPKFRVEVVGGRDRGVVTASEGIKLAIGTEKGNELVLTDAAVSRHHCEIEARAEGFLLRDLQSRNGTELAGHRVLSAFIAPGEIIQVGESAVRFDVDSNEFTEPLSNDESFGEVLGSSVAMRRVFSVLNKVASAPATLLITGETGTGKGAVASAVHDMGPRAEGPFVVVDCGAIPDSLIESELFGHEKGAFTGAEERRIGAFEQANGGTIFLDEIGELGLEVQPKLLRVLEGKQVQRVGGTQTIDLDIRIIAATNRDLRADVNEGKFRSDLYFRLNVVGVELPPLRERREDIPLLVERFYKLFKGDDEAAPPADLIARLMRQHLPGNVRELRAAVERVVVLGELAHGPSSISGPPSGEFDFTLSYREAKEAAIRSWEDRYLPELLERYDGNLSRAARAVRMDRNHLRKLLTQRKRDKPED